jgi:hypothetical protein
MDVNQAQIQAGMSTSVNRVCITTGLPDDGFGVQFAAYEHDNSLLEHKKRCIEVGTTSKTTSAERNQKSR